MTLMHEVQIIFLRLLHFLVFIRQAAASVYLDSGGRRSAAAAAAASARLLFVESEAF